MFVQSLINTVVQLILFSLIPLIWWLITARKKENFFTWIGLKKPVVESKSKFVICMIVLFVVCEILGRIAILMRGDLEAADSAYKGMGAAAIPSILMYSFGQTAFTEEILFRGFLLKRFSSKFGFVAGQVITAVIFGAIHLTMVWGQVTLLSGAIIVIYPMVVAFGLGWINEKKAGGSILPSWIIHGLINTIEVIGQAFM